MKVLELTYDQLLERLRRRYGKGPFHAAALYREIFKNQNSNFTQVTEFSRSPGLVKRLHTDLDLTHGRVVRHRIQNGVIKFITRLSDQNEIESVILPMFNRLTLCLSSQAGCRMGCRFCETGKGGFSRNLSVAEIVGQVYSAQKVFGARVRNLVFMGMGEPFDNFDHVIQAIRVLSDQRGINIARRRMTVSSVGHLGGLQKLAELAWPDLNLAISVNAPNDEIRSRLMPVNHKAPMASLQSALLRYPLPQKKALFIEYVVIKGVNDRRCHAHQLAEWLAPLRAKVNLIPYNQGASTNDQADFQTPSAAEMDRFRDYLVEKKVFVRLRQSLGSSIMAGCGQLGHQPPDEG